MTLIPSSPKEIIELISKGITLALQLGILTGSICVVSYCLRINYFPQELSIGDGLLFLIVAACFGTIYTFLFGSLVALVIVSSSIDKWITKSRNHFRKRLLGLKTSWALLALLLLEDAVSSVLSVALLIAPTVFLVSFFGSLGALCKTSAIIRIVLITR